MKRSRTGKTIITMHTDITPADYDALARWLGVPQASDEHMRSFLRQHGRFGLRGLVWRVNAFGGLTPLGGDEQEMLRRPLTPTEYDAFARWLGVPSSVLRALAEGS